MRTIRASRILLLALAALWLGGVLGSGCATPKVDWTSRIGTYTYDDAVRELGPPNKSAKLSDNSMVADWLTGRGMRTATAYGFGAGGYGYGRYGYGYMGPQMIVMDPATPDRYLRLSFDPDGKLASWKRVYQ
ncbi:MAG: hypothetical protein AB7O66_06660 [Limisphaerales bacterium]